MKIIDCFLFYNELELLKFKLKELNDIVDYFVLIESKYTFVGNEKELYYEKNKVLFSEYNHKIIHVIHDHNATTENSPRDDGLPNAWYNEKEQRFYGTKGISKLDLADDDLIILARWKTISFCFGKVEEYLILLTKWKMTSIFH